MANNVAAPFFHNTEPDPVFFDYQPTYSSSIMYKLSAQWNTGDAIAKIQAIRAARQNPVKSLKTE